MFYHCKMPMISLQIPISEACEKRETRTSKTGFNSKQSQLFFRAGRSDIQV